MGRPVKKKKDDEKKDPSIYPRYQAMSTWTPRATRRSGKK